jgi:hypothetical protein
MLFCGVPGSRMTLVHYFFVLALFLNARMEMVGSKV